MRDASPGGIRHLPQRDRVLPGDPQLAAPCWDRHGTCRCACQLINAAPGGILDRFGFRVQYLGTGAWVVAGHRDQKTGAGR